jgi:hypothetical protein
MIPTDLQPHSSITAPLHQATTIKAMIQTADTLPILQRNNLMAAHHSNTDMVIPTSNNSSTTASLVLLVPPVPPLAPMGNVVSDLPFWVELVERSLETNSAVVPWAQSVA